MKTLMVDRVSKSYQEFRAVEEISFSLENGQLFGLLGPNGAGKTTTMRMIMNIIVPDSGKVEIFGNPFCESVKNRIGYLPEERGLYLKMKLLPLLQFMGEIKGMSGSDAKKMAMEWLDRFGLSQWTNNKIQELSKGMQQKVQFIGTIMHTPDLLIVDEPFSGLDPINTKFLKDILLGLKKRGKSIILSTHLMDQAEKLCDHICLINRGKLVLNGSISEIKSRYSQNNIVLEYSGDVRFIKELPFIDKSNDYGNYIEIKLKDKSDGQRLFGEIAKSNLEIKRFEAVDTSLNDIFIEMVGGKNDE